MQPEFDSQMREILESVERAEVVCIIFPLFGQCLVFDGRHTPDDPPQMAVSPPMGSAERRLRQLNQARPHLPKATEMTAIPWSGSVASMARTGIWEMVKDRMITLGPATAEAACEAALNELLGWEHRSNIAMIKGQGPFHTVWSRSE